MKVAENQPLSPAGKPRFVRGRPVDVLHISTDSVGPDSNPASETDRSSRFDERGLQSGLMVSRMSAWLLVPLLLSVTLIAPAQEPAPVVPNQGTSSKATASKATSVQHAKPDLTDAQKHGLSLLE